MRKKSVKRTVWLYTSMLLMTISLLVFWIWYIIHSHLRINELAARFGGESGLYHWVVPRRDIFRLPLVCF